MECPFCPANPEVLEVHLVTCEGAPGFARETARTGLAARGADFFGPRPQETRKGKKVQQKATDDALAEY